MSMEGRSYLASDLAQELGVARSTINDWLARYADYLEVEIRGKRKVYSEKSLRILREISELRNSGAGSFDIEQQLASRYGIRPEVAPESGREPAGGKETDADSPSEEIPGGTLPALRPAFDEMAAKFTGEFSRLADKLEALEAERRRLIHRMWTLLALVIVGGALLVVLLGLALWLIYGSLTARSAETAAAVGELSSGNAKLAVEVGELAGGQERSAAEAAKRSAEFAVLLDRSRSDFTAGVEALRRELAAQREEFERQLKKLESSADSRAVAEILKLKAEFAKAQQAGLEQVMREYEGKLAAATERDRTSKEKVEKAERELSITREELESLRKKITELEAVRSGKTDGMQP